MQGKWVLIAVGAIGLILVAAIVAVYVLVSRYDFNDLKPRAAQAVMNATGRELTMQGDIELKVGLAPALVANSVSFQNAPWGSRPHMAAVKRLEVQVALIPLIHGDIEVKRLTLIEPDIIIETDRSGESNLSFERKEKEKRPKEEKPAPGGREMPTLSFNKVRVEDAALTFRDGKTGKTHAATIGKLTATQGKEEMLALDVDGAYDGRPIEVKGTLGPMWALTDPRKPWPLKLTATTPDAVITIDGSIRDVMNGQGMDLHVAAESQSLAKFAAIAGAAGVPDVGPLKVALRLTDPAARTYKFAELNARLADSDIGGWLEVRLDSKRPRLTAELRLQVLDIRAFGPKSDGTSGDAEADSGTGARGDKVFSEGRFSLDPLKAFDGDAKIQAERILLPRLSLSGLTAEVTLEEGALTVEPVQVTVGEGTLNGNLRVAARGDAAELSTVLKVEHLNLGLMLKELAVKDVIEGNLDADIQLAGRGVSVADLMSQLNGNTVLVMGSGRINNKYIKLLGTDAGSGVLSLLNPLAEGTDYTELNCFVSRFDIVNGIAASTALVADTTEMTVLGDGTIDLRTERLNMSLKPSPKKGIASTDSALPTLSLGEIVKPFKLAGTLAHPKLAVDPTESAIIVGKAVGGTALFGPAGIVAALAADGKTDGNPCLTALEAAKTGVKVPGEEKGMVGQAAEDVTNATKTAVGEAQRQIKKLFGR